MFDYGSDWARWIKMSPRLSGIAFGAGGVLLCLFLIAKIDQIRRDENALLHRWATSMRWWRRRSLLRDLHKLRDALEKRKADPYAPDAAIRVGLLMRKHSDLLKPVGDNLDDVYRAVVFCIETLEIENNFSTAMGMITERLKKPFRVEYKTTFHGGAGAGGVTMPRVKARTSARG